MRGFVAAAVYTIEIKSNPLAEGTSLVIPKRHAVSKSVTQMCELAHF